MGIVVSTINFQQDELFVVLSALLGAAVAAPAADADASYLGYAGVGLAGHGVLAGHGLAYGAAAPAVATVAHAAPVAAYAAAPVAAVAAAPAVATVAHAAPVAVAHAAPVAVAHAAPVAVHHAVPTAVAVPTPRVHKTVQTHLVPETRLVGHQVHTNVHHVPQVAVNTHTSTHTTHHVINHPAVHGAAVHGGYAGHGIVGAVAPA